MEQYGKRQQEKKNGKPIVEKEKSVYTNKDLNRTIKEKTTLVAVPGAGRNQTAGTNSL